MENVIVNTLLFLKNTISFLIVLGLLSMIIGVNFGLIMPIRVNHVHRNKFINSKINLHVFMFVDSEEMFLHPLSYRCNFLLSCKI